MRTLRGVSIVLPWILGACHGSHPTTRPAPAAARFDPAGFTITLTFSPAAHIAVYEWQAWGTVVRISPLRQDRIDSLTLATPAGLPRASWRAGLEPRILVTTSSGWEQPLGQAEVWSTARLVWTPPAGGVGRSLPPQSPIWFVVSLPAPLTQTQDAAAQALDVRCCVQVSSLAADIAAVFGVPPARVWALGSSSL